MSRTYSYSNADTDVREILTKVSDAIMDDTDVAYWVEQSDNYIDSKLAFKYDVPFTTTPPVITIISAHLTAYFVLRTIKLKSTESEEKYVNQIKKFATDLLNEIITGKAVLIDSSGDKIGTNSSYGFNSSTLDYSPIFNLDDEINWEVDPDRIGDLD